MRELKITKQKIIELKITADENVLSIENYYDNGYELNLEISYAIHLPYTFDVDIGIRTPRSFLLTGKGRIVINTDDVILNKKLTFEELGASNVILYEDEIKGIRLIDSLLDKFEDDIKEEILEQGEFQIEIIEERIG